MKQPQILIVGLGNIGGHVLDMLARTTGIGKIIVAGRNKDYLHRRANLSMFVASQFGYYPEVKNVICDLSNIEQTAETLFKLKPDLIFNATTVQPHRVLTLLPKKVFQELDQAQLGPWLPMHLSLMYKLMQAIKQTHLNVRVINAAFPDAVNPILKQVGLAPTIGIGHVANIIPALRKSISFWLGVPITQVEVFLIAQRYVTSSIPRFGHPGEVPCYLRTRVNGIDMTDQLDLHKVYDALPTQFKRVGGTEGNLLTAASAAKVIIAMANNTGESMHAPGPNGLPGGYPVKVDSKGGSILLPEPLTLQQAIHINEEGQRVDGIEKIDLDGTVHFSTHNMAIMKRILGYECKTMKVEESEEHARELKIKCQKLIERF